MKENKRKKAITKKVPKQPMKEYAWSIVRSGMGYTKVFGSWTVKETGQPALCQVKGCGEKASWATSLDKQGIGIVVCFKHGEDATRYAILKKRKSR